MAAHFHTPLEEGRVGMKPKVQGGIMITDAIQCMDVFKGRSNKKEMD